MELTIVERDRINLLADVSAALASSRVDVDTVFVDVNRARRAVVRVVLKPKAADVAVRALCDAGFKVSNYC